ncbi:MAG: hypothetical protein H6631_16485 [Anaerolineaceae bacterium]|nr:hypothetical protein [Anaerolineaceae bacterium]
MFDTGGECFEKPTQLVPVAGFVRRAEAAMLLISIADLDDARAGIQQLLNTYIVGMGELSGDTKNQNRSSFSLRPINWSVTLPANGLISPPISLMAPSMPWPRPKPIWIECRNFRPAARLHRRELPPTNLSNAAEVEFQSLSFSIISALVRSLTALNCQLKLCRAASSIRSCGLWKIVRRSPPLPQTLVGLVTDDR